MLKKIISVATSAIVVLGIVGCSNQSPVSVSESSTTTERIAGLSDEKMWDISSGYNPCIWGASGYPNVPNSGYVGRFLYYYQQRTNSWIRTNHWGDRVAVTSLGKCFYSNYWMYFDIPSQTNKFSTFTVLCCKILNLNGSNEIDSAGSVAEVPTGERIIDIAAGTMTANKDRLWILCYPKTIYKADIDNGVFKGWIKVTAPSNVTVNAIAADLQKGGRVIIATNLGADTLTTSNTWQKIQNTNNNVNDVSISADAVFYTSNAINSTMNLYYHSLIRGTSTLYRSNVAGQGVTDIATTTPSKVWYLNDQWYVMTN